MKGSSAKMIRRKFSASASTYDEQSTVQRKVAERLGGFLPAGKFSRILEIGCGTGLFSTHLLERFINSKFYLFDLSPAMVATARKKITGRDCWWFVADAREFRLNCQFPLIVSSSSLHWAQPLEKLFNNLQNHLAPGGLMVFSMMLKNTLWELQEVRNHIAPKKLPRKNLPAKQDLLNLVSRVGFSIENYYHEELQQNHNSGTDFLWSLNKQGVTGGQVAAPRRPLTPSELKSLVKIYETNYSVDDKVQATYEVIYLTLKKGDNC